MTTSSTAAALPVRTRGAVNGDEVDYARHRIGRVLRTVRGPVLFVRVKLSRLADPALDRPAVAQVNVDLNGRLVRAQVARPTMSEAVDEVSDRLRERLHRAAGGWEAVRGSRPSAEPHEWRHTAVRAERPTQPARATGDRRVVRRKAFGLVRMTVDEAAMDLDLLDHDFELFIEAGSGEDSVLYRAEDGAGCRLAQVRPSPRAVLSGAAAFTVSGQPAPELTVEQARDRLAAATDRPFVFFREPATGRGQVLYHRYDGHDGLIAPPE